VAARAGGRRFGPWALLALVYAPLALPAPVAAQTAWVPVAGEGHVSAAFQHLEFDGHFDADGGSLDGVAASRSHLAIFEVEYGLTERVALTARLPYIASKFTGTDDEPIMILIRERYEDYRRAHPEAPADTSLDTGNYYATFQDVGLALRYNVWNRGLTITPVIGLTFPSHHYRTIGEASPGQDRTALHTGINLGRLLDPFAPNVYVHGRYTYSFVQRISGIRLDRSSAELEAGYAITPIVSVRGLLNWMKTHGGIGFEEAYEDLALFLTHDRLLAGRYWHVGAGATVSLTDSIDLDAAVLSMRKGADTHSGIGFNVEVSWHFFTPRAALPPAKARRSRR